MTKTLIACGCSFTKDNYQKTWPDYLAQQLGYDLLNIGARGAGVDFIGKRLMMALNSIDPANVLVGILLPSSDRFDLYVDQSHVLKDDFLKISSWQNGSNPHLVNLDGSFSSDHGYSLTGGESRGYKKHWYMYYHNNTFAHINYWFNVINIQNFLKLKGFEYFFASAYDIDNSTEQLTNITDQPVEYDDMKSLVDFKNFVFHQDSRGFLSFVDEFGYEVNKNHPESTAHQQFVTDVIVPFLKNKNLQ